LFAQSEFGEFFGREIPDIPGHNQRGAGLNSRSRHMTVVNVFEFDRFDMTLVVDEFGLGKNGEERGSSNHVCA
jgi:hypothetical protein